MKILYVTSFNERLYKLSGVRLVYSFLESKTYLEGDLLICYEGTNYIEKIKNINQSIKFYDMTNDKFLIDWLKENEDIIPKMYGGRCVNNKRTIMNKQCICFRNDKLYGNKKRGCLCGLNESFRRKSSLWFRKIASFNQAVSNYSEYDMIVWIDSDCIIKKQLTTKFINSLFQQNKWCFYNLGIRRRKFRHKSVESGFLGFKKENGYELLKLIIEEYQNKKFRKYIRWDDGHVIGQIVVDNKLYPSIDLSENLRVTDVLEHCILNQYITHCKGSHFSYIKEKQFCVDNYIKIEDRIRLLS